MADNAKWIWPVKEATPDSYADFFVTVDYNGGDAEMLISTDSDYTLYIDGEYVNSDQYKDFPYYKVYDRLDISENLKIGKNEIKITVWYYGIPNSSYYPGKAGLWYYIKTASDEYSSGSGTLSRINKSFKNGLLKSITGQLGLSFEYDTTVIDDDAPLYRSIEDERPAPAVLRPVKKLVNLSPVSSKLIKSEDNRLLFDLSREEVGYLHFKLRSDIKQRLIFSWGEHIADGWVRSYVGGRDFSAAVTVDGGFTEYTNYFRRLGLRYLEVKSEYPLETEIISVIPCPYPLEKKTGPDFPSEKSPEKRIYDTAVRTLELCMHDHYEDCPWREQALYALDSRNQMLCGYYAFGEFDFPRATLRLMSMDNRTDGLLSICTPDASDLTIPSFSLHYFTEVCEYTEHSGDISLALEIMPKLKSLMNAFTSKLKNGLIPIFSEPCHWNFYEWSDGLCGEIGAFDEERYDCPLNALLSIALQRLAEMCRLASVDGSEEYLKMSKKINRRIFDVFYDSEKSLFRNSDSGNGFENYSELANSLAILCGALDTHDDIKNKICGRLTETENALTPITLATLCFKYDALLRTDKEKYRSYILENIAMKYKPMLDNGATSFWETEKGQSDFGNAGSLCHGWSAMPVYYYNTIL